MRDSAPATAGLILSDRVSLYRLVGSGTGGMPGTVSTGRAPCAAATPAHRPTIEAIQRSLEPIRVVSSAMRDGFPDRVHGPAHDQLRARPAQLGGGAGRVAVDAVARTQAIRADHARVGREHQ